MDKKSNKQNKSSAKIALQEIQTVDLLQKLLDDCNDNIFLNFKLRFTMEEEQTLIK